MRYLRGFGFFWWDFLVGDTPEVFVGSFIVVGIAALAAKTNEAAAVIVPAAVLILLAVSIAIGKAQSK